MLRLAHIVCLLNVPYIYGSSKIGPIVETKLGSIIGLESDNGQYIMYLGVPYAVVDEKNPFGPSVPHPPFDCVYEAYDESKVCPQVEDETALGSIDCLRLNIYVPKTPLSQNRLPVMLWLHYAAFIRGSGNREIFGPDFLVRHDVIIVSINFRLGPYGFLCLDDPIISGNQGLKDQLLAFKWVNENIQSFGGNPSSVTLFGESSGAKSIHLHLLSENERLYDKVIIQSGIAVTPLRMAKPDSTVPLRIAAKLGFHTECVNAALRYLSNQNVQSVAKASHELGISKEVGTILPETRPCIENKFDGAVFTDYPFNIRWTKVKNITIMYGFNSQEMLYKFGNAGSEVFDTYSFKDRLEYGLDLINDEMANTVKRFYIGDANVDMSVKEQILNFESDFNFYHPTIRTIKRYMEDGVREIYNYLFSYEGDRNLMKSMRNITMAGASHVDEIGYLFNTNLLPDKPTTKDHIIIDRMTTLWTNFAKYGDPTPERTQLLPVKWLPVDELGQHCLKIDSEMSLIRKPFRERMAFWDDFYQINGESQNRTKIQKAIY